MNDVPLVPLALAPEVFDRHHDRQPGGKINVDHAVSIASAAANESRDLARLAISLHHAVLSDETMPLSARLTRAKSAAGPLLTKAATRLEAALTKVASELAQSRRETAAPLCADPGMAAELRSVLRSATPERRGELIAKAIADGDDTLTAALFNGHAVASGMAADELEARRHIWRKKNHPAAAARQERLAACERDLKVAGNALVEFTTKLFHGATKLEQAAQAANEAISQAGRVAQ